MLTLVRSSVFAEWLEALRDDRGKARILNRLDNAAMGNFVDCQAIGDGVSEMRIHLDRDTASISCAMAGRSMFCFALATRPRSAGTL